MRRGGRGPTDVVLSAPAASVDDLSRTLRHVSAAWNVRSVRPADHAAIRAVNLAAFETAAEASLVDALRDRTYPVVSLVAEEGGRIIGHIMFSPVTVLGHPRPRLMGLAPMAVLPSHQNRGIGSALVRAGLQRCGELGFGAVVALGH